MSQGGRLRYVDRGVFVFRVPPDTQLTGSSFINEVILDMIIMPIYVSTAHAIVERKPDVCMCERLPVISGTIFTPLMNSAGLWLAVKCYI